MIFKQIFRVAFIALIWKKYKGLIVSSTLLLAYIFLVSNIHEDYLTNIQLQNDTSDSGMSFVYKWAAYVVGVFLYFSFHAIKRPSNSDAEDFSKKARTANQNAKHDLEDPFAAIREKENLRSRADFIEQERK